MSERNVELARRWVEAYNARDIKALISCCDPSIEFHAVYAAVGGGVYHGHDGLREFLRDVEDAWGMRAASNLRGTSTSARTPSPTTCFTRTGATAECRSGCR